MIPQLGFLELIVLAALALVVVGPKDLPRLMNGIGKFLAQAKAMANEFRAGFDQMAREAEIDEMRKEIDALREMNPLNEIKQAAEEAVSPLSREKDRGHVSPEDEDPFFPAEPPEVPADAQVQIGDIKPGKSDT